MSDEQKVTDPPKVSTMGEIKNPTKLWDALDEFKVNTKQAIDDFGYVAASDEEEDFDPLKMLAGIPDEDLDIESVISRNRAALKLALA